MLVIVIGPGGVGKGTVIAQLLERDPHLWLSRSWTTRARRSGEPEDAYTFVDRARFERRVAEGGFLEWAQVLDDLYGTPVPEPPAGCDVLLEIDVQGAEQVHARRPDAVCILLVPPSSEVQEQRLRSRGDSDQHVERRLRLAETEVPRARAIADHVVVNDDLATAVDQLAAIIEAGRSAERA
jgi:guanylate kinase